MELKFDSRRDILEVFPTRLFMFAIEGAAPLNDALKAAALGREAAGEANAGGAVGGWRSTDNLFDWPDKGIDTIRQTALGAAQTVIPQIVGGESSFETELTGYVTVLRYGGYEKRHLSPGHHLTMVYTVEAGDAPNADAPESGTIEIDDPRAQAELASLPIDTVGRSVMVTPQNGQLMVFPSWLHFHTNPYFGDGERVSLTINAEISDLKRK
ncbi:2OG-Fe(II) oxygenase family protein [Nisaea acidiphila]|uniref:2OG-Fe(II) oxygenase family protein n=1 Tax=Nisaea acidiphila TaxID=1862145 RepID=A0A9J7AN35_9PROT|nr:2OG-Fe(II) oxygenase family protein [Nisaea acidiphila]UUX48362.1 2OG-Fe(II) oxygenase family protein [Nisaea acidiphila]